MKFHLIVAIGAAALATVPAHAALVADYQLNGSFADALAGPDITGNGGTLGATGYSFGANEGLSVGGFSNTGVYSIETRFSFSTVSGYRKILDFQNLVSDSGLYNLNTALNFYPVVTSVTADFAPNVATTVIFTRDAGGNAKGYVNGALAIAFVDGGNLAVIPNILNFFIDDNFTLSGEASSGFVDYVRIYDTAIVPGTVPEPASWALMIAGFGMVGGAMRRRVAVAA